MQAAKDSKGHPGLHRALDRGRTSTVTAFMDRIGALRLNAQQIEVIVAAKQPDGMNGLAAARKSNRFEAEKAYMAGLAHLRQQGILTAAQISSIKDDALKCVVS